MKTLDIDISTLFAFGEEPQPANKPAAAEIEAMVRQQFAFLPQPLTVEVRDDTVRISFPEESAALQAEAARLASKGAKRAAEGDMDRAIGILTRVLELQPSLTSARRDLAMAYSAKGDVENARDHLIEVLRIDPKDHKGWVVLANLYAKQLNKLESAERFIQRALELAPDDALVLNSLGAIKLDKGQAGEAKVWFRRAIAASPTMVNPYYGLALISQAAGELEEAETVLKSLFGQAKPQDERSRQVLAGARQLLMEIETKLAAVRHAEVVKSIEALRLEAERLSGYPVEIVHEDFADKTAARMEMAWKRGRDHHVLRCRKSYPQALLDHLTAHELTHLRLECAARSAKRNKFFVFTAECRENAIRSVSGDIRRLSKLGYDEASIASVSIQLVSDLARQLFNTPIDLVVEARLTQEMACLWSSQVLSMQLLMQEAHDVIRNPKIKELTPKKIYHASLVLNGAFALFVDEHFGNALNCSDAYRSLGAYDLSSRMYLHWRDRLVSLGPGDEYSLVDESADMLGLRTWYEWRDDPGTHEITETA